MLKIIAACKPQILFFIIILLLYFVYVSLLLTCKSGHHMCTCGGQKREGTMLQMALNCHVGAGTQTWLLWKSGQCS